MKLVKSLTARACLSAAAAAAVLAVVGPTQAADVTLRMHSFLPPIANPPKTFLIPWAKKVEEASKGRIKVQPFWAMQLGGKPPTLVDQVKDGVVDIIWTLPGYTPGRFPKSEVFELPFIHKDALSTTLAMQDFQEKHLKDEYKDFRVLLLHAHAGFLFMTKRPITKFEDVASMKLRAPSRIGVWMLNEFGATSLGLPLPEIPAALSKGVIDGMALPYEIAPAVKAQDLVTYFTDLARPESRLATAAFTFLMNPNSYSKLPADLKKVIDDHSGRNIAKWAGENWEEIEKPGQAAIKSKSKNQFSTLSPAESDKFRATKERVYERWFSEMKGVGVDGKALLEDAKAMIAKYHK